MTASAFGPVELFVLSFPQPELPSGFTRAIAEIVDTGAVTLLDLVVVRRPDEEQIEVVEIADLGDHLEMNSFELGAQGLIGDEDLHELAGGVPVGETVVAVAIEHTWARRAVGALMDAGASVVTTERIPATVVNEVADLAAIVEGAG